MKLFKLNGSQSIINSFRVCLDEGKNNMVLGSGRFFSDNFIVNIHENLKNLFRLKIKGMLIHFSIIIIEFKIFKKDLQNVLNLNTEQLNEEDKVKRGNINPNLK